MTGQSKMRKMLSKGGGALWPWFVVSGMLIIVAAYIWLRILMTPPDAAGNTKTPTPVQSIPKTDKGADNGADIAAHLPAAKVPQRTQSSPADPAAVSTLNDRFFNLASDFGGEVGIAVRSIDDGWVSGYRLQDRFPQQSVSKLWVATTVMDKVDSGEIDLDDEVTLTRSDLSIFHQPIRKKILAAGSHRTTIRKLLWYAMTQSDNTANDFLFRKIGGKTGVDDFFARKGVTGIAMSEGEKALQMQVAGMRWEEGFSYGKNFWIARGKLPDAARAKSLGDYIADPVDGAQPQAIATTLVRLATGGLFSRESTLHLMRLMSESKTGPKRLRGGLSAGWRLPHKTGTGQVLKLLATGYNDVGILISPSGRSYAIAVMIGATNRPVPERQDLMQAVTRAVISCENDGVAGCI